MKAEEKIVAFICSFQLLCSLYIHWKKNRIWGWGEGWRGTRAEGQEGQILVADNMELQ